ncbi:KAS1 [Symbiodinium sp. CCMP2592]|nr:KAS1 [Symbiodinium sp. CCMP2592]
MLAGLVVFDIVHVPSPLHAVPLREQRLESEENVRGKHMDFLELLCWIVFGVIFYMKVVRDYPMLLRHNAASTQIMSMHPVAIATGRARWKPNFWLSCCCFPSRQALNFHAAGIAHYWLAFVGSLMCPCCLTWYSLTHRSSSPSLQRKLGGRDYDCWKGAICACFCSCCIVTWHAEALDAATGVRTGCCGAALAREGDGHEPLLAAEPPAVETPQYKRGLSEKRGSRYPPLPRPGTPINLPVPKAPPAPKGRARPSVAPHLEGHAITPHGSPHSSEFVAAQPVPHPAPPTEDSSRRQHHRQEVPIDPSESPQATDRSSTEATEEGDLADSAEEHPFDSPICTPDRAAGSSPQASPRLGSKRGSSTSRSGSKQSTAGKQSLARVSSKLRKGSKEKSLEPALPGGWTTTTERNNFLQKVRRDLGHRDNERLERLEAIMEVRQLALQRQNCWPLWEDEQVRRALLDAIQAPDPERGKSLYVDEGPPPNHPTIRTAACGVLVQLALDDAVQYEMASDTLVRESIAQYAAAIPLEDVRSALRTGNYGRAGLKTAVTQHQQTQKAQFIATHGW